MFLKIENNCNVCKEKVPLFRILYRVDFCFAYCSIVSNIKSMYYTSNLRETFTKCILVALIQKKEEFCYTCVYTNSFGLTLKGIPSYLLAKQYGVSPVQNKIYRARFFNTYCEEEKGQ